MTRSCIVAIVLMLLTCCAPDHASIKSEISRLLAIQERVYGNHSPEAMDTMASTSFDSLMFIGGEDGGMMNTAQAYAHDQADGYIVRPHHHHFQIYDNTVIVTSLHQGYKMFNNDTLKINTRSTKIFARQDGVWKMAYITFAPLPVIYDKTTKVDSTMLKQYAGIYQLSPTEKDSIIVDGDRLYSVAGNYRSELKAINDSTFIGDGYFGKTTFSKNRQNQVTHYRFEWFDGQQINFARLADR